MTTVYVQNRSPHHILKNMTPKEAFFEKKPSVEHLRIFGCQSRRKERTEGSYDGRISIHHDEWEIVPRPEGKSVVKNVQDQVDGISINTRRDSWIEGSPNRREKTAIRRLLQLPNTPLLEPSYLL
jgi:hypothetical protein